NEDDELSVGNIDVQPMQDLNSAIAFAQVADRHLGHMRLSSLILSKVVARPRSPVYRSGILTCQCLTWGSGAVKLPYPGQPEQGVSPSQQGNGGPGTDLAPQRGILAAIPKTAEECMKVQDYNHAVRNG